MPMAFSVFIADDDVDTVDLLARRCRALGVSVTTSNDAASALDHINQHHPDVAILDVGMPNGSGLDICEMTSQGGGLHVTQFIILTGSVDNDTVRRCHQMCAYYVLKHANVWERVEPLLREFLQRKEVTQFGNVPAHEVPADSPQQDFSLLDRVFALLGVESQGTMEVESQAGDHPQDTPWILAIEDDEDVALALQLRLQEIGAQMIRASAGREGYRRAFLDAPRAILLDYELPQGNGDYVLRRLKESPVTRSIPVVVLTGHKDSRVERQMRALGAAEYLTKPFDWKKLRSTLEPFVISGSA